MFYNYITLYMPYQACHVYNTIIIHALTTDILPIRNIILYNYIASLYSFQPYVYQRTGTNIVPHFLARAAQLTRADVAGSIDHLSAGHTAMYLATTLYTTFIMQS